MAPYALSARPTSRSAWARWGSRSPVALKFGKLVKVLKATTIVAKFAKVWITVGTMAASIVVYAFTFGGWWLALGLVVMILVHELGHVWAMRCEGMETKAPVFIPLLGAVIFAPPMKDREQEARIGYAGPLVGGAAALAVFLIALTTSGDVRTVLLMASYLGAFINLFNLIIPIRPLDGGRVTQIVGDWFKYLGLSVLLLLILLTQARGLLLIAILVLVDFKWPAGFKAAAAVGIELCMIVMVGFGLGHPQPVWADVFDIAVGGIFTALFIYGASAEGDPLRETQEPNTAGWTVRLKWLALYLGLTAALVALMLAHVPLLPSEITNR